MGRWYTRVKSGSHCAQVWGVCAQGGGWGDCWGSGEGGREGGGWICTRGTSRFHKGMEQIGSHSFIRLPCIFSPCLTGRASSTTLLLLSLHLHSLCPVLCLQVRSITISLPFLSFSLLFFSNPSSLRTVDVGKKICRLSSRNRVEIVISILSIKITKYFDSWKWNLKDGCNIIRKHFDLWKD